MVRRKDAPEVVYVERDSDSSVKWLLWGAAIGGALALLYAPRSGEETRRSLQRNMWKLRAMTEEKLDELVEQYVPGRGRGEEGDELLEESEEEYDEESDDVTDIASAEERPRGRSARAELEQRLAQARARRRAVSAEDDEEPLA